MCTSKEVAKFLAGFMFAGVFSHLWMAYHPEFMPLKFWGMTVTSTFNNYALAFHVVTTFLLVYYGWISRLKTTTSLGNPLPRG